jgi:hypothetical protein
MVDSWAAHCTFARRRRGRLGRPEVAGGEAGKESAAAMRPDSRLGCRGSQGRDPRIPSGQGLLSWVDGGSHQHLVEHAAILDIDTHIVRRDPTTRGLLLFPAWTSPRLALARAGVALAAAQLTVRVGVPEAVLAVPEGQALRALRALVVLPNLACVRFGVKGGAYGSGGRGV